MAQVVERYFREVEAASSSLVTPIVKNLMITDFPWLSGFLDSLIAGAGGFQTFLSRIQ